MESFEGVIVHMVNMSHLHSFCTLVGYQKNVKLLYKVPYGDCVFKHRNIEEADDVIDTGSIRK